MSAMAEVLVPRMAELNHRFMAIPRRSSRGAARLILATVEYLNHSRVGNPRITYGGVTGPAYGGPVSIPEPRGTEKYVGGAFGEARNASGLLNPDPVPPRNSPKYQFLPRPNRRYAK